MLKLFHLLSKIPLTTYKKWQLWILYHPTLLWSLWMSPPSTPIFLIPMASKPVRKFGNLVRLKCHLPTAWLQCSRWYLKRTTTFNGDHYLQINGTAMAPSYANICMGKLEKQLLESSIERPLSWYRFIDDVDMKWTQNDEELQNFLSRDNNLHPSIKFTHEISNTTISFLDTSSSFRKVYYSQIYTPNLPTPINTFCLVAVILLMWLRAYHTVKLLESGEFAPPTNL